MDDIIITGSNSAFVDSIITQLQSLFALKDLGLLHYFLGIQVHRTPTGLILFQSKYIQDLLLRLRLQHLKSMSASMVSGKQLYLNDSPPFSDPHLYCNTLGLLQYLLHTRPDIVVVVNKLSQFSHAPTINH